MLDLMKQLDITEEKIARRIMHLMKILNITKWTSQRKSLSSKELMIAKRRLVDAADVEQPITIPKCINPKDDQEIPTVRIIPKIIYSVTPIPKGDSWIPIQQNIFVQNESFLSPKPLSMKTKDQERFTHYHINNKKYTLKFCKKISMS